MNFFFKAFKIMKRYLISYDSDSELNYQDLKSRFNNIEITLELE